MYRPQVMRRPVWKRSSSYCFQAFWASGSVESGGEDGFLKRFASLILSMSVGVYLDQTAPRIPYLASWVTT
jgi:hypothetical protein